METANITLHLLNQFTGTSQHWVHWTKQLAYTDGVHYLVENGAAWVVDLVASYQLNSVLVDDKPTIIRNIPFQLWEVEITITGGFIATLKEDSDMPELVRKEGEFTDLPIPLKLYVENGVLLLPGEH